MPFKDEKIKSLNTEDLDSLRLLEEAFVQLGIKSDEISVCVQSKNKKHEELLNNFKRMSNYLRFRLSYQKEDLDYNQANFIVVHQRSPESLVVSVNGESPTVLDIQFLRRRTPQIENVKLTIPKDAIPDLSFLKTLLTHDKIMPDESRFWRALDWYGRSFIQGNGIDEQNAILCLAVAFEALLGLPEQGIGGSFASYISNFFHGSQNLVSWAKGFYDLRSKIIHGEEIYPNMTSYSPKASNLYIKSVAIARPIFRDLVEGLYVLLVKKKQHEYDDAFLSDHIRIGSILDLLNGLSDGFMTIDDINPIGFELQELRRDCSTTFQQVRTVSHAFLTVLRKTFLNTRFSEELKTLIDKFETKQKMNSEDLRRISKVTFESLTHIKNADDLPLESLTHIIPLKGYEETASNFYSDCIELCVDWFDYAQEQLYLIDNSGS
jgi:Apea-like HEPN